MDFPPPVGSSASVSFPEKMFFRTASCAGRNDLYPNVSRKSLFAFSKSFSDSIIPVVEVSGNIEIGCLFFLVQKNEIIFSGGTRMYLARGYGFQIFDK